MADLEDYKEDLIGDGGLAQDFLSGKLSFEDFALNVMEEEDNESDEDVDMEAEEELGECEEQLSESELEFGFDASQTHIIFPEIIMDQSRERSPRKYHKKSKSRLEMMRRRRKLPNLYQGMLGEANLTYARGDSEGAEKICREVMRICPKAAEPYRLLATLYTDRGLVDEAFQFRMISAFLGVDVAQHEWTYLAGVCRQKNMLVQAVQCYNRAIRSLYPSADLELTRTRIECAKHVLSSGMNRNANFHINVTGYLKTAVRSFYKQYDIVFEFFDELKEKLLARDAFSELAHYAYLVYCEHALRRPSSELSQVCDILLKCGKCFELVSMLHKLQYIQLHGQSSASTFLSVEQLARLSSVRVQHHVSVDIKYMCVIALIRLSLHFLVEEYIEDLKKMDTKEFLDIIIRTSEAFIDVGFSSRAMEFLSLFDEIDSVRKVDVKLLTARCQHSLGFVDEAIATYSEIIELVPDNSHVRQSLSAIFSDMGEQQRALAILCPEPNKTLKIDANLLLQKIDVLLNEEGWSEKLYDTIQLLLSQHCPQHSNISEEIKMSIRTRSVISDNTRCRPSLPVQELSVPVFLDTPIKYKRHWELFIMAVKELEKQGRYEECGHLISRARGSREFINKHQQQLDEMLVLVALKTDSMELGFPPLRRMLFVSPQLQVLWNTLNVLSFNQVHVRSSRFLQRLQQRTAGTHECADYSMALLKGHQLLLSSTYKHALVEYLTAHRLRPRDPLPALMVGVTHVHCVHQKLARGARSKDLVLALAFLQLYRELRGDCQEVFYNLGRAHHQLGLTTEAIHYYRRALHYKPALEDPRLDLSMEIAHNMTLIYRSSGNTAMARALIHKYLVV